jgi:hypothetical protein
MIIIITLLDLKKISNLPAFLEKIIMIISGKELQIKRILKMKSIKSRENRYLQSTKCIKAPSSPQV